MRVSELMTPNPTCCTPETSLQEAAAMMVRINCGSIPVVENEKNRHPVGIVTDRDIVCRAVAEGKNPLQMKVKDCYTTPVESISEDADAEEVTAQMEQSRVRRMLVVDENGRCCGIVAQADLATKFTDKETADVVRKVSQPV